MGSTESTLKLVVGFAREVEKAYNIDSKWNVSETDLILSVISAYISLKFNEAFHVGKDVAWSQYNASKLYSGCVDSASQLMAVEGTRWLGVVDMNTKQEVLSLQKSGLDGEHASHWVTINGLTYLSAQLGPNQVDMLQVNAENGSYKFVEEYSIHDSGRITYCDFSNDFRYIVLVIDGNSVQRRLLSEVNKVEKRVPLEEKVESMVFRNIRVSPDGRLCALSAGHRKGFFFIVDFENERAHKFTSTYLSDSNAPCFINNETELVAVSDHSGRVEIWDIAKQEPVKTLSTTDTNVITSSASVRDIYAIASFDKQLRLYDVRNWECFYTKQLTVEAYSLRLTPDLKYVSFAGQGKDQCVVYHAQ